MEHCLKRLNDSIRWLARGAGLGVAIAVAGAVAGGLFDGLGGLSVLVSGAPFYAVLLALPFGLFYGVALILLIVARHRLRSGLSLSDVRVVTGARNYAKAAIVVIAIGLAPNGYLGLAAGLGAMGIRTTGDMIALLAGWTAQWPPFIGAIAALVYLADSMRAPGSLSRTTAAGGGMGVHGDRCRIGNI